MFQSSSHDFGGETECDSSENEGVFIYLKVDILLRSFWTAVSIESKNEGANKSFFFSSFFISPMIKILTCA